MIFKRDNRVKEMPTTCLDCPSSPLKGQCNLPLTDTGRWTPGHDKKRHEHCPLIEITSGDIDFILRTANSNRDNSAGLAEVPEQRWKEAHKHEVEIMDNLIQRAEIIKQVLGKQTDFRSGIREVYVRTGEGIVGKIPDMFIEHRDFWDIYDNDDGYTMIYLDSENRIIQ